MELPTEHVQPADPTGISEKIETLIAEAERFVGEDNKKVFLGTMLSIRRKWGGMSREAKLKAAPSVDGQLKGMFNILELLNSGLLKKPGCEGVPPGTPES